MAAPTPQDPSGKPADSPPRRSLSQEVWSATLWNTLLLPARILVGFVGSIIYFGKQTPEQVAAIALLTSLAATIGMYADLGIERTLPRYVPEIEQRSGRAGVLRFLKRIIGLKLAILAVLIVILNLLAAPVGRMLAADQYETIANLEQNAAVLRAQPMSPENSDALAKIESDIAGDRLLAAKLESEASLFMVAVSALLILGALFDVFMQFLTAYFKQRAWNLITLATTLLQPLLVSTFILLGWGIEGVLLGLVIAPLLSVVLAGWQALRASRELEVKPAADQPDPTLPGRFARFAGVSYLLQMTTWLYDIQFVLFIGAAWLDAREVAALAFTYKFAKDYLGYIWMPLNGVMTPLLSRIKLRRDPASLRDAHASLVRMIWLIVVPAGVGLSLLTPRLIAALYPTYADTSALAIAFIAFTFGESLLSVAHNVLMVYEQYKAVIVSRLLAFLVIPLVFLLMPRYGLLGVAVAVGMVRVLTRLITVIYGVKKLGLTLPWDFWGRVCAASASFAVALLLLFQIWPAAPLPENDAQKIIAALPLVLFSLIGAAIYLVTLKLLGGLDPAERERLLTMRLPFKRVISRVL